MKFNQQERKGIYGVAKAVTENLNWIFRESLNPDVGIDAYIEVCELGVVTGQILSLQIKSGSSYFLEKTTEGIIFRGNIKHLEYWKNRSIPTLLVLHNPENSQCYWQVINDEHILLTKKSWKIFIPYYQKFDSRNERTLVAIASHRDKYIYNLNNLRLAKRIMKDLLAKKNWYLYIHTEPGFKRPKGIPHYVNLYFIRKKIPGFNIYQYDYEIGISLTFYKKSCLFDTIRKLLPWADITYLNTSGIEQEEVMAHINNLKNITDWTTAEDGIKSQINNDYKKIGLLELASYVDFGVSFEAKLTLNDFGRAFLIMDQHLTSQFLHWGGEII